MTTTQNTYEVWLVSPEGEDLNGWTNLTRDEAVRRYNIESADAGDNTVSVLRGGEEIDL